MNRRHLLASAALFSLLPLMNIFTGCGEKKRPAIRSGATVLALGDSLTEGYGATLQTSYPTVLKGLTGWNVINAGVTGDTSADALKKLPTLLAQHKPDLVIISIGGNDILRRQSETQMRANITAIIDQVNQSGAQSILVAAPRFSIIGAATGRLNDHPMYEEIAKEKNVPLLSDAWSSTLSNDTYKSDAVHGNASGYNQFAQLLAKRLREIGYLS